MRRIFRAYGHGVSPREIAKRLNRERVAGPSGATWGPSTINGNRERGTGILNNELYIGRLVWNRLRYIKDPATGKRRSRLNPVKDWITTEVPELRIVPQELWEAVKTRQDEMLRKTRPDAKRKDFWELQRPRYLLSGLMKCGCCGASYVKSGLTASAVRGLGIGEPATNDSLSAVTRSKRPSWTASRSGLWSPRYSRSSFASSRRAQPAARGSGWRQEGASGGVGPNLEANR